MSFFQLDIKNTYKKRPLTAAATGSARMHLVEYVRQGLIFVKDPYFNEPGFEKYQGTEKGDEYSRRYNLQIEHAIINYAIKEQLKNPPEYFKCSEPVGAFHPTAHK
ncbi:hypothetical protein NECAME_05254 [Necator americanus]|uniref:Uncharacterized protein n=1 Tax=Necator americanus TaxID=51031 RepID=W2SIC0_NECAM|nr:hypothetical protein NECAME_05254 [Necator americanus]ETN69399.1 hypothetical protein NECAME_05254 [Necator americanus]